MVWGLGFRIWGLGNPSRESHDFESADFQMMHLLEKPYSRLDTARSNHGFG